MKITVAELRDLCEVFLSEMESRGLNEIDVKADYYWSVPMDEAYNVYEKPDLTIGSLDDDSEELKKILTGEYHPLLASLPKLSSVLYSICADYLDEIRLPQTNDGEDGPASPEGS